MIYRGVLSAFLLLAATSAKADLTVCNKTDAAQQVAVAYSDGAAWLSEGWWGIDPGACKVLLSGKLAQRHYYYTLSGQPEFAGEGYGFCVTAEPFTLTGADGDCAALGGEPRRFAHIDTGPTAESFSFDLTGPAAPVIKGEVEAPMIGAVEQSEDAVAEPPAAAATGDAFVDSFAQGTYGEPFTVTALMQGCDASDAVDGCVFYAEGVRWIASFGAANNPAALEAMAALPVNAPVIVSGDMVSMGDITVEAVVSRIEIGEPDAFAALRDAAQGDWVSQDDASAKLRMTGSEQTDIYGDEVLGVSVVTFADACPGGENIGPVFFTQQMGGDPADLPCYAVVEITPERMELSYVGRGNTLVYLRP